MSDTNKSDLIRLVSVKMEIPMAQAEKAVDAFFDAMTDGLANKKRVELRGFGSFQLREYDSYTGRNPRTGESVDVPPKVAPFFKAGKDIKQTINK